ncbi:MAG: ABC transporter ATP-binding protein [Betaproteobacteria bacterium]|nr:ABC transporter ATP-binding protein [Betaproteobacteria bacterium]MCC6249906.1 ABC transporter ATP-binding protein [Rubrivivax sp.]
MSNAATGEVLLAARTLTRRFGGIVAVDNVSIEFARGSVHAVIGTNGAGKSTLINLLSGELPASAGQVLLAGRDVTHWTQPQRARAGIGRSYQRTTVFAPFSVQENCRLAAQARYARPFDWWTPADACRDSVAAAREAAASVGLEGLLERPAAALSHGQRRQLEIAMCLAAAPQVLLLDEPLAGMGAEETERMLALLERLKPQHAVALVEHDMDAVFRIADRITVMVNGGVIASGTPAAVRADPQVQAAYLGESAT